MKQQTSPHNAVLI